MAKPSERASDQEIREGAKMILAARYVIALTGAGMSVESGIPPFRGPGGLWTKYGEPPMNGYQRFLADPRRHGASGSAGQWRTVQDAARLPGRIRAISRWRSWSVGRAALFDYPERRQPASAGRAACARGDPRQLGFGPLPRLRQPFPARGHHPGELPPHCPQCGGILKSDTVSFGEPIPTDVLNMCAEHCARRTW